MSDQNAPAQAGEAETALASIPCESLAALRDAHLALRRSLSGAAERRSSGAIDQIRAFMVKACKAGAFLDDPKERRAAQTILDYWSAELAASPMVGPNDYKTALLDQPDPSRARSEGNEPPSMDRSKQRALIRFSAQARRWQDSGRRDSDLLRDKATIEEASRFASQDKALAELVKASEDAIRRAKEAQRLAWGGLAVGVVVTALVYFGVEQYWRDEYLPNKNQALIAELGEISEQKEPDGIRQTQILSWFFDHQRSLPPLDFSKVVWRRVTLEGLRLSAPNFVGGAFERVTLKRARLAGATFNNSNFAFEGTREDANDFSNAALKYAQFRDARIAFTSFADADLYRAIFDKADLCQVDFSGANLRHASFWGTKMDVSTKNYLRKNAWWQVEGIPWSEIRKFADKETAEELKNLKASAGFNADLGPPTKDFERSAPGSLERAKALAGIAWARAIWGIDVIGEPEKISEEEKGRGSCGPGDVPINAVQAADRAVCIANKLNEQEPKGRFADLLANLRDTQAYVYMQNVDKLDSLALGILRQIASEADIAAGEAKFFKSGEPLFHYAIAQYVAGEKENDESVKGAAVLKFKKAIENYQPTHELHTLKGILFGKPFEPLLETLNRKLWPGEPESLSCPAEQ